MDKLGYACINMTLADNKITVNRGMVKKTFQSKGLAYVSELTILNIKDMVEIIKWNERNGIKNYRMSSDMFPWFTEYKIEDLPNYNTIKNLMKGAGTLVKTYGHKVSLHPGPFNCLASPNPDVVRKTIYELEQHSKLMDLMELDENPFYNINIHVGGVYDDKDGTIKRFADNFGHLSSGLKKRLTIENDDGKTNYIVQDLYKLHQDIGIPIVFDSLHFYCNNGGFDYTETFNLAYGTWGDITPEVHHSSSRKLHEDETKTIKTHADWLYEPFNTCGKDVWITIESKMKEKSLIKYRKDFCINEKN